MIRRAFESVPDNKPISALCIIEDITKCPAGFITISKTHDQDSDADLYMQSWKEYVSIGQKSTRYLCLSKTEGNSDYILVNIDIINEKQCPPYGYCLIPRTTDSDQKAFRKRQLCYKLMNKSHAPYAITDIILLSRLKKAPNGYNLIGDLNGLTLCYKTSLQSPSNNSLPSMSDIVVPSLPTENVLMSNGLTSSSSLDSSANILSCDRPMLLKPIRSAPEVPTCQFSFNYSTSSSYQSLEGIPFVLKQNVVMENQSLFQNIPQIKKKTREDLDLEYNYDFEHERQV